MLNKDDYKDKLWNDFNSTTSVVKSLHIGFQSIVFILIIIAISINHYISHYVATSLLLVFYVVSISNLSSNIARNDDYVALNPISKLFFISFYCIIIFSIIFYQNGLIHNNSLLNISWFDSLYFSFTTWTTLGYGDFSPGEKIRLITSIEAILGYITTGILVALIMSSITSISERRRFIEEIRKEVYKRLHKEEKLTHSPKEWTEQNSNQQVGEIRKKFDEVLDDLEHSK
jgi:voltage-gated potassium channel Kch